MILTSNRTFGGWGAIFGGDVAVAAAMSDRLVHHAEIISLKSDRADDEQRHRARDPHLHPALQDLL
jgi:DNA replication protein DnaC